jgi:hypothetical protein
VIVGISGIVGMIRIPVMIFQFLCQKPTKKGTLPYE